MYRDRPCAAGLSVPAQECSEGIPTPTVLGNPQSDPEHPIGVAQSGTTTTRSRDGELLAQGYRAPRLGETAPRTGQSRGSIGEAIK